jgi:hypothetical protein
MDMTTIAYSMKISNFLTLGSWCATWVSSRKRSRYHTDVVEDRAVVSVNDGETARV